MNFTASSSSPLSWWGYILACFSLNHFAVLAKWTSSTNLPQLFFLFCFFMTHSVCLNCWFVMMTFVYLTWLDQLLDCKFNQSSLGMTLNLILSPFSSSTKQRWSVFPLFFFLSLGQVFGMEVLGLFTRRLGTAAAAAAACKARDTGCDMERYYINKQAFTWLKHVAGKRCFFFFFPSPWHTSLVRLRHIALETESLLTVPVWEMVRLFAREKRL